MASISTTVLPSDLPSKAASQPVSLYQRCSALRDRLVQIRGFLSYFSLAPTDNRQSTDPVTQLWDLFSLGDFNKINYSEFNEEQYATNPDRAKKHAIALFAIQIRTDKVTQNITDCECFTVTDLWDRSSTDGFVKVVDTVTAIVNHLPADVFETSAPSPALVSSHAAAYDSFENRRANAQAAAPTNIIREIVETERKYTHDLDTMQKYATALSQRNLIDPETIELLFPNLTKLLNFQRELLVCFEGTAELEWQNQRWGWHFLQAEEEFSVYEPYCVNYPNAAELMLANEHNLAPLNHLINVRNELPAFLIKPVSRVCRYPLLLEVRLSPSPPFFLLKASSPASYPHYAELKLGLAAARRVTEKINEAQCRAENARTVKVLRTRADDWNGHRLENFGELLLHDVFVMTKSTSEDGSEREYHVFLFEKIIVCCREPPNGREGGKSKSKSNSILNKRKNTHLSPSRVLIVNVTQAVPAPPLSAVPRQYPFAMLWKGDDVPQSFTLRCRREDQMRQWEAQINRLVRQSAQRRACERCPPHDGPGFDPEQDECEDCLPESGSSQPMGDGSDHALNSSSPITPLDASESSLGGAGMRPAMTAYDALVERVGCKVRLCASQRDDGSLRIKYEDEDGDMVALGSTGDVEMAFEQCRPGGQVTL
ncbi:Dbl homology domain-containing protein [Mycena sp. CBHHK59/15]|nr:Dbl homology domain-containing protein [Mycena sp. CBHHK59/15]